MARFTYKHFNYKCSKCDFVSSILKEVSFADRDERCEKCEWKITSDDRLIQNNTRASSYAIIGAKVQNPEYNPGLGCVVKNKQHREDLAKRKGVVEVGNDYKSGDKMQTEFEKKKKEEIESSWAKEPSSYVI